MSANAYTHALAFSPLADMSHFAPPPINKDEDAKAERTDYLILWRAGVPVIDYDVGHAFLRPGLIYPLYSHNTKTRHLGDGGIDLPTSPGMRTSRVLAGYAGNCLLEVLKPQGARRIQALVDAEWPWTRVVELYRGFWPDGNPFNFPLFDQMRLRGQHLREVAAGFKEKSTERAVALTVKESNDATRASLREWATERIKEAVTSAATNQGALILDDDELDDFCRAGVRVPAWMRTESEREDVERDDLIPGPDFNVTTARAPAARGGNGQSGELAAVLHALTKVHAEETATLRQMLAAQQEQITALSALVPGLATPPVPTSKQERERK